MGVMEATALGKKLFFSLLVRDFIDLNRLPDGSGSNSEWPGCVMSLMILLAFFCSRLL